jgi:two-component system response regulator FixJ
MFLSSFRQQSRRPIRCGTCPSSCPFKATKYLGSYQAWGPAGATATANEKHADALDAAERVSLLSQRMRQVLDALAEGRLSKELAEPLGLSVRTVELHRARMLDRLGVRTAAEAVRLLTLAKLVMPS